MANISQFTICSYNCRGYNLVKQPYLMSLLSRSTVLFLQEHWLSEDQCILFNDWGSDVGYFSVSGFSNEKVLSGRPFGGCAIVWCSNDTIKMERVKLDSRRMVAVKCEITNHKFLLINVYLPYAVSISSNNDDYFEEIMMCESLIEDYQDYEIFIGGDFNADLNRQSNNTDRLTEFCNRCKLKCVDLHTNTNVDYTYHFGDNRFSVIDHFIVNEHIFNSCVKSVYVSHDIDNLSDHEPLFGVFDFDVVRGQPNCIARNFCKKFNWSSATEQQIIDYQNLLTDKLSSVNFPIGTLACSDIQCNNINHVNTLNQYCQDIYKSCIAAASAVIPSSSLSDNYRNKRVVGWNEYVKPYRDKSLFWHHLWCDAGKPRSGVVADIMRLTRSKYHYEVRNLRKHEEYNRKEKFAESILNNNRRDFWKEVNKMKRRGIKSLGPVDGLTDSQDVAEVFASKYSDLYKSVHCSKTELDKIGDKIDNSIRDIDGRLECIVHVSEVLNAIEHLKANKQEGLCGLSSDFFINAGYDMSVHIALLISAMFVHGFSPSLLTVSTIIPIPKGNTIDKCDSCNYRAISLSSILCKIIDLVVIARYGDCLVTSSNQFGFKPKGSTDACTMLVKETIAYYRCNDSDLYCVFLDASKAFDRVNYSKLFCCLFERKLPIAIIRLLFYMYTNHTSCVFWNGSYSEKFPISNGVKQGGILSPILFCVYVDGLLNRLAETGVGCYVGSNFLGALAYADDFVLMAPTPSAMRVLLNICNQFANEYSITFNGSKSKCIHYAGHNHITDCLDNVNLHLPSFFIGSHIIDFVDSWSHLGHILSSDNKDNLDIEHRRIQMVKQVNDVLCYFGKLDAIVKLQLLYSYCSSLFGSVLWDMSCNGLSSLFVSWRRALKRIWRLPSNTHSDLLYGLCGKRPIHIDITHRTLNFIFKCINSDNSLVRSVTRYMLSTCHSSQSPIQKNYAYCCTCLSLRILIPDYDNNIDYAAVLKLASHWSRFNDAALEKVNFLFELIMLRDGVWNFRYNHEAFEILNRAEVSLIIDHVCTA